MTSNDWYFARGNKQMGPVSSVEMKRRANAGELRPDDLVWREGLAEWTLARNVHGLFDPESNRAGAAESAPAEGGASAGRVEPPEKSPQPAASRGGPRHPLDSLLDRLRSAVTARSVEAIGRLLRQCGLYGLLAAMVLVAAFATIESLQSKSAGGLLFGVALVLLLIVLHYVAGKFCDALDRLHQSIHGSLPSSALPDCIVLLSLASGVAAILGSVVLAMNSGTPTVILPGFAVLVVCGFFALVMLHPETLNVWIAAEETSASEEAIGVLTFLVKAMLALALVVFGVGVVYSALLMSIACWQALSGELLPVAEFTAAIARRGLIGFAALPLVAYLLLLFYSLLLDLCRSVLALPEKFDRLTTKQEENQRGQ